MLSDYRRKLDQSYISRELRADVVHGGSCFLFVVFSSMIAQLRKLSQRVVSCDQLRLATEDMKLPRKRFL